MLALLNFASLDPEGREGDQDLILPIRPASGGEREREELYRTWLIFRARERKQNESFCFSAKS